MNNSTSTDLPLEDPAPTLGHGDHWRALGFDDAGIISNIESLVTTAPTVLPFRGDWSADVFAELVLLLAQPAAVFGGAVLGKPPGAANFELVSAFPIVADSAQWPLMVEGVLDSYGAYAGVIALSGYSGQSLQGFAPRFGLDRHEWVIGEVMPVQVAGLAMGMERYAAEPIVVTTGPMMEIRRNDLRAEGRHDEADDPNLSVTVHTDTLRSLFSTYHDHHEFVGKVLEVTEIPFLDQASGWQIDLECFRGADDQCVSLPVCVFPTALVDGYIPRVGDLVSGVLWLQVTLPLARAD